MRRGERDRLLDIRAAAGDALAFTGGLDADGFTALPTTDRRTWRAEERAVRKR